MWQSFKGHMAGVLRVCVFTGGKTRSVLFGKKIPNKIAEKFANRVKVYRPYPWEVDSSR